MRIVRHLSLLAAAACLWWAASCGSTGSTAPGSQLNAGPVANGAPAPVDASGLPSFPVESGPRTPSANGGSLTVLGKDFLQQAYSTVDGDSLDIGPSDGQEGHNTAYGLYKFEGLSGKSLASLTVEALPGSPDMEYYIGLADFTHLQWKWLGPSSLPEFQYDFSGDNDHYISPLGNVYFIVATHGANTATHSSSTLAFGDGGGNGGHNPGAPTDLQASDGTYADHVGLTWNAGDGAQSYEVWRHRIGDDPNVPEWGKIGDAQTTSFSDTDVVASRHYYYKVRSVSTDGNNTYYSDFSNVDSGYIGDGGGGPHNPGAPSNLVASDGTYADHVVIHWAAGDGAQWYEVWRYAAVEGEGWVLLGTTEHTEYSDTGATPGHVYYYKARSAANGDNGNVLYSDYSNIDSGYAGTLSGPGVPHDLVASDGTYTDHVAVTWLASDGAQWYELYRADANSDNWALIATTNDLGYNDTDVTPGTVYQYRVRAGSQGDNGNQYSGWSNTDTGYAAQEQGGTYTITGSINDGYRAGTTVTLLGKSGEAYTIQLAAGGAFTFDGLVAGSYLVFPYNANYQFSDLYWSGSVGPDNPNVTLSFTGGGVVNPNRAWGFVWQYSADPAQAGWTPLSGITVNAHLDGHQDLYTGTTDDHGFYGIGELPAGTIVVQPTSAHYTFTPVSNHMTVDGTHLPAPLLFRGTAN
jgi:fibronectin type 3 domain-containing protein